MLLKTKPSFTVVISFVLPWWIINEFDKLTSEAQTELQNEHYFKKLGEI